MYSDEASILKKPFDRLGEVLSKMDWALARIFSIRVMYHGVHNGCKCEDVGHCGCEGMTTPGGTKCGCINVYKCHCHTDSSCNCHAESWSSCICQCQPHSGCGCDHFCSHSNNSNTN